MPSPTVVGTTASTPTVISVPTIPTIASIAIDGGTSPCAQTLSSGMSSATWTAKMNDHAARTDITPMVFAGIPCIVYGLTLSWTSGLTINIAAGLAIVEGEREIVATTKVLADNSVSRVYMQYDGAILAGTGAYAPANSVLLGTVTTSGGSVTVIDVAGVFTMAGAMPVRQTADTAKPVDTPTTKCPFLTLASNGVTWLWDGTQYICLTQPPTVTLTDGATVATDASLGTIFGLTLNHTTATRALSAPTNAKDGMRRMWLFKQDSTGGAALTLDAMFKVPSGITFSIDTTANKTSILEATYSSFVSAWIVTNFTKSI